MRQERTSNFGDEVGLANPTRSKAKFELGLPVRYDSW